MQPSDFMSGQYSFYTLNHLCVIIMIMSSALPEIHYDVVALHAVDYQYSFITFPKTGNVMCFYANLTLGMHSLWLSPRPWDCFKLCYLSLKKKKKNLLKNKLPCSSVADLKPWFLIKLSLHDAKVQLTGHNIYSEPLLGSSMSTSTF